MPKLNHNEHSVLRALTYPSDAIYLFQAFATLQKSTGLDRKTVRRACRSLARKHLAEYDRGLVHEDGSFAGAGYACTEEGFKLMEGENAADH